MHLMHIDQVHGRSKTDPKGFVRDLNIPSDQCYHPTKCPPRRSRLAKSELSAQKNAIAQQKEKFTRLQIESPYTDLAYAVLTVYREAGYDSPVHAVGGSIWKANEQIAEITPVHCEGMTPVTLEAYMNRMLLVLHQQYGIRKFAAKIRRDPQCCPIRPCFHHPERLR
jgi:hypothetical protein